jgi:hypothetical protein
MSIARLPKSVFCLIAVATIAWTAAAVTSRFRDNAVGALMGSISAQEGLVSLTSPLSPAETSKALHALTKYNAAKPLRASDDFHRWCFDGLEGAYPLNSRLRTEVGDLLVQSSFHRLFPGSPPLFFRSPYGWEVRQRTATSARGHWEYEHHVDQFLATCAQIDAPLSLSVETDFGRVSIGELLDASRRSFDISQELCWTLIAYCSYLPTESPWQNRFGEVCSYESIVNEILSLPMESGSCGGTHKQFALAYFMKSSSGERLTKQVRRQCEEYLAQSSRMLEQSQLPNGAWTTHWAKGASDASDAQDRSSPRGIDLIRITGHQLEWVDIAPAATRPSNICTSRAIRFLADALDRADISGVQKEYCAYSHAACVLRRALQRESAVSTGETTAVLDTHSPRDFAHFRTPREGSSTEAQTP